jgi:hypothetical protein
VTGAVRLAAPGDAARAPGGAAPPGGGSRHPANGALCKGRTLGVVGAGAGAGGPSLALHALPDSAAGPPAHALSGDGGSEGAARGAGGGWNGTRSHGSVSASASASVAPVVKGGTRGVAATLGLTRAAAQDISGAPAGGPSVAGRRATLSAPLAPAIGTGRAHTLGESAVEGRRSAPAPAKARLFDGNGTDAGALGIKMLLLGAAGPSGASGRRDRPRDPAWRQTAPRDAARRSPCGLADEAHAPVATVRLPAARVPRKEPGGGVVSAGAADASEEGSGGGDERDGCGGGAQKDGARRRGSEDSGAAPSEPSADTVEQTHEPAGEEADAAAKPQEAAKAKPHEPAKAKPQEAAKAKPHEPAKAKPQEAAKAKPQEPKTNPQLRGPAAAPVPRPPRGGAPAAGADKAPAPALGAITAAGANDLPELPAAADGAAVRGGGGGGGGGKPGVRASIGGGAFKRAVKAVQAQAGAGGDAGAKPTAQRRSAFDRRAPYPAPPHP